MLGIEIKSWLGRAGEGRKDAQASAITDANVKDVPEDRT